MTEDEAVKLSHHNVEKFLRENSDRASIAYAGERRRSACERILGFRKLIKLFMMSLLRVMNVSTLFQNYPQRYENLDSY